MIAISYRRQDSLPVAGRLYDRLKSEFGKENVFMDFDSIPYGVDFRQHIRELLDNSKVLVALIGPDWFGRVKKRTRRIDDPSDFIRLEIAYAFERRIPVIPVLLGDTKMPKAEELPTDIKDLAFRNAITLDIGLDFHHHTDRLVNGINRLLIESTPSGGITANVSDIIPPPEVAKTVESEKAQPIDMPIRPPEPRPLFEESQLLTDPAFADKTPTPSKTRPPTYLPPAVSKSSAVPPPDKKPAWEAPVKKWSAVILLGWISIKLELRKRRNLFVFAGPAIIVILLLISTLYVAMSRSKMRLKTGTGNAASEDALRERRIAKRNSASPATTASTASPSAVTSATSSVASAIASPNPTTPGEPSINPKEFARSRFALAHEASERGYFASALALIDQAEASDPNQPSIMNLRGEILLRQKEFDLAEAAFQKVLELDPTFPGASSNLAQARFNKQAAEKQTIEAEPAASSSPDFVPGSSPANVSSPVSSASNAQGATQTPITSPGLVYDGPLLSSADKTPEISQSPNGSGIFQLTRAGGPLVWNNYPRPGDEASWSGGRDAEGYATGNGTIIWFKRGIFTTRYTGRMIRGKLDGPVINQDANGKKFHGTFINGVKSADWSGDRR